MTTRAILAAILAAGLIGPAAAQGPGQTGTGGSPGSTITAPNTSALGRTMPPAGGGEGARSGARSAERETSVERKNDRIDTGICIGCNK